MIIGFSGSFGAGKSSRAEQLAEILNWPLTEMLNRPFDPSGNRQGVACQIWRVVNFADALKDMIKMHFGLELLDKNAICEKYGSTYGQVLQKFGQGMRDIDPDYWLDEVKKISRGPLNNLVIGDVRYQNELDWIKSEGGMVFYKEGILESSIAGRDLNHPSECVLDGYTAILPAESSIKEDCEFIITMLKL